MNKDNTVKQCVLICEPITGDYESSNVFVSLGVTPVIEYCMSWLIDNGIKQIFLFYSKSKQQVEEYHQLLSGASKPQVKMHLNYMKPQQLKNFGDVLREVQFRNIIAHDFLVVFADTITNLDLTKAIQAHFKKKLELKSVVLTSVLRENSYDKKIHITNSQSTQILQMDQDTGNKFTLNSQRINLKKMNVEFRRDLSHCDIYICTADVLKSFKENYEYASMFDFINGMLTSEVYEEKILGHILENHEYTYRLNRAKYYYLAYLHFIANHFYPFTLCSKIKSFKSEEPKVVTKNFNKVLFNGISIPRTTYISNNCYIGQKATIGANVTIQKSIIERGCKISSNATIRNCLILEGCTIAQKAVFENCLIQRVNQAQQIKMFSIFPKYEAELVTEPLFEQTPPPQQSTFQEQLQQVVSQQPRMEIVNQLNSIRKHHNKSLQQFLKQMIKLIAPQGSNGVESFALNWGPIILKIHQNQNLLLESLYYSCQNIPAYEKAFHVFIQYLYREEILKDFIILAWFNQATSKYPGSVMLQKCEAFIKKLQTQMQQESGESNEQSASEESN